MCLHCGPKPREAHCGEIAQQAHDVSEVIFRSSVRHTRLTGSRAQRQSPNTVALQDTFSSPKHRLSRRAPLVRGSIPIAAILVPAAFFLSVLPPDATVPNALIYLAYVGAVVLAAGVLVLGIGLVRHPAQ
jgi:hypothetical protein